MLSISTSIVYEALNTAITCLCWIGPDCVLVIVVRKSKVRTALSNNHWGIVAIYQRDFNARLGYEVSLQIDAVMLPGTATHIRISLAVDWLLPTPGIFWI
jgi:hypothetical protein